jgi:arylsulfatase A-like enzyme
MILIDIGTLRADHLGCYGYERETSPSIDALAAESVVFEWCFSQAPNTAPSQASIMTGLYPGSHGLVSEQARLPERVTTLAEVLADHGYATAAFVDGGYLSKDFGLDQGFQRYSNRRGEGLDGIAPRAIDWLRQHADENFLLLVHTYDTHAPYMPPASHRGLFLEELAPPSEDEGSWRSQALYDAEIRHVDDWIGTLMAEIRELGLDRRATIALVSDHGEEFMEHGAVGHDKLYGTVTRVPLMIRLPGGAHAGTVPQIVETIDLMPTLLELAGAPAPPGLQGASLLPLIRGEGRPPYTAFGESAFFGGRVYAALGGYRLLADREGGRAELYHFLEDPLELRDLAAEEPERVEVLRRRLATWREAVARSAAGEEQAPVEDETLEQLRSLGYVQ